MDRRNLDTVSKLVNRATSDNPPEADAAAKGALSRLKKAGGTFEGFLRDLDPGAVFQSGLVRVADRYAAGRDDLSEASKRELYAKLIAEISAKYSGAAGPDPAQEADFRRREDDLRKREREAAEREAEARRKSESAHREAGRRERPAGGSGAGEGNPSARRPDPSPSFSPAELRPKAKPRPADFGRAALAGAAFAVASVYGSAAALAGAGMGPGPVSGAGVAWMLAAAWAAGTSFSLYRILRGRGFFSA